MQKSITKEFQQLYIGKCGINGKSSAQIVLDWRASIANIYYVNSFGKKFSSRDFLIIAPNNLFLDYISAVLPDLGVEKIHQSTFADLAARVIDEKYKLMDSNRKLTILLSPLTSAEKKEFNMISANCSLKY